MKKIIIIAAVILAGVYLFLQRDNLLTNIPSVSQVSLRATEKDFEFIKDQNVRRHFVAQSNQTSYRVSSYSSGADLTFLIEVKWKDEDFNDREIQYQGKTDKELKHKINIGDTVYVKDYSDGKWWKQTIKPEKEKEIPEEEKPDEPIDFKDEYLKKGPTYEFIGMEACGKLNCFKYREIEKDEELGQIRTFWFDDKKYLLRKEEVTAGEFTLSSEYSYDNINIQAPSPTKDVPEGKSIYDY